MRHAHLSQKPTYIHVIAVLPEYLGAESLAECHLHLRSRQSLLFTDQSVFAGAQALRPQGSVREIIIGTLGRHRAQRS